MTKEQKKSTIQSFDKKKLLQLWDKITKGKATDWDNGSAFEYLILRAFELEKADVQYPYSVYMDGIEIEQIDGYVYIPEFNLPVIIESKDRGKPMNIEPIAKLRNQLLRRPSSAIGTIFSKNGFTTPALLLGQFLAPSTILFWEKKEIDFALKEGFFVKGTIVKYKYAIENGISNFVINADKI